MASRGQLNPPVKRQPKRKDPLTVMILGSVGKVHSFKISLLVITVAAIFVLLSILTAIYSSNKYFDLRYTNSTISEEIDRLREEVSKKQKLLDQANRHRAILEDYIQQLESPEVEKPRLSEKTKPPEKSPDSVSGVDERLAENQETTPSGIVDITDVVIQKERFRIAVSFKVVNLQTENNPVRGYIHIIAMGRGGRSPDGWTFPYEKLRNGLPVNYRRGQLFLIQRFKPVQGKFDLPPNSTAPISIRVLVYGKDGELLLEKEFEVTNEL